MIDFRTRASRQPLLWTAALLLAVAPSLDAQDRPAWERRSAPTEIPVAVFHSTQSANLPTAETVQRGELLFEISHRFEPRISSGSSTLWGLDGGVVNRLGLAVGVHDRVMVGLTRSNLEDNLDLSVKARLAEGAGEQWSWMVGALGGIAVNPEEPGGLGPLGAFDESSVQLYAQGIVNVLLGRRLALGVVPSVLRNPAVYEGLAADADIDTSVGLGAHAQLYVSEGVSFLGEWQFVEDQPYSFIGRDVGTLGIELETGGHFFKIVVTNSPRMNTGQFLAGGADSFHPDNWRFGFNVTRLLHL